MTLTALVIIFFVHVLEHQFITIKCKHPFLTILQGRLYMSQSSIIALHCSDEAIKLIVLLHTYQCSWHYISDYGTDNPFHIYILAQVSPFQSGVIIPSLQYCREGCTPLKGIYFLVLLPGRPSIAYTCKPFDTMPNFTTIHTSVLKFHIIASTVSNHSGASNSIAGVETICTCIVHQHKNKSITMSLSQTRRQKIVSSITWVRYVVVSLVQSSPRLLCICLVFFPLVFQPLQFVVGWWYNPTW